MYRFHSQTILLLSILFTSLFSFCARTCLTTITKDSVSSLFFLLLKLPLTRVLLCRFFTHVLFFFSRKNYKNIQKNNVYLCVCDLLFESRDRDAPKWVLHEESIIASVAFAKKVYPKLPQSVQLFQVYVCVCFFLLDSLILF